MKSIVALAILCCLAVIFSTVESGRGRYNYDHDHHDHDRHYHKRSCGGYKCCRQKIDYGRCYKHVRRWAYNITCGQCVPFDYSGCGGDDNNFSCIEDCNSCCKGCSPCPRFALPKPASGCEYRWHDDQHGCPKPALQCSCPKTYCRPDACSIGQRCVPNPEPCNRCPCPQYTCVTDPCYAVSSHLRPCESCVSVPAPTCKHSPCPLVAIREDKCGHPHHPHYPHHPHHPHGCPVYVQCPPTGSPCSHRSCPAHPAAKCHVDPCDCRKYTWSISGVTIADTDCYYGKR